MSAATSSAITPTDGLQKPELTASGPSLFAFTSHLSRRTIRNGLDPWRWTPVYLTALKISVQTGIEPKAILEPLSCGKLSRCNALASSELLKILSKEQTLKTNVSLPRSLKLISVAIRDIVYSSQIWEVLSDHVLSLLENMIKYMLSYIKAEVSRKASVILSSRPGGEVCLKYRKASARFRPIASLHPKVPLPGHKPWSLPMLSIVTPYRRVDHYAQEVAHLLTLAQYHLGLGKDVYQPYVLTIRGTRVSILTASVDFLYIHSVQEMEVRSEGLQVLVSEEFDMAVVEGRVRFVSAFEELLMGLIGKDTDARACKR